ncbi:MAG: ribokinase [Chloroflexota bacterium]|nr:ribokinase [Chloroflexota bacterium]MDE2908024.1 ribokinase [Chloroflexota bacterium]
MPKIFVVGSYNTGLTIRVPRMPALGESLVGDSFDMGPGGKGSNQAIGAARLGADVRLLVCLGDDIFAKNALRLYQREGIGAALVHQIAGASSGIGFVNILPSGENWITVDLGANLLLTPQHVRDCAAEIHDSDILMTQLEIPLETAAAALRLAKENDTLTILNPAPAQHIEQACLADVDILTPNASEARILLGLPPDDRSSPADLARGLLGLGARQLVVTLGAEGALIASGEAMTHIPALPIQAVDVTGAGDSFNAALAVSLGAGASLEASVRYAVKAGAHTALRLGVIDGLPTAADLENLGRER